MDYWGSKEYVGPRSQIIGGKGGAGSTCPPPPSPPPLPTTMYLSIYFEKAEEPFAIMNKMNKPFHTYEKKKKKKQDSNLHPLVFHTKTPTLVLLFNH